MSATGVVFAPVKGVMILPPGWKTFDLSIYYYDPEVRSKINFTTRWFFESAKRWEKYSAPIQDSIIHVSGRLIGRMRSTIPNERMLAILIDTFETIARPATQEWSKTRDSGKGSAWKRKRADPSLGPSRSGVRSAITRQHSDIGHSSSKTTGSSTGIEATQSSDTIVVASSQLQADSEDSDDV